MLPIWVYIFELVDMYPLLPRVEGAAQEERKEKGNVEGKRFCWKSTVASPLLLGSLRSPQRNQCRNESIITSLSSHQAIFRNRNVFKFQAEQSVREVATRATRLQSSWKKEIE